MTSKKRILLGVVVTLATVATGFPQYEGASRADTYRSDGDVERSGYSYVRETVGGVTVQSRLNGRVTARRNMPISAGDEILVSDAGRAEIGLADGNLLFVGGGTRARFSSLYAQQGEDDDFSAIDLRDGSVLLASMGYDEGSIPRIDTEDATVYLSSGSRVRVNADPRRGTVVIVRSGSVEVRTRGDSYTVESGQYLMVEGDEPAEIARGVFSRDRFDLWAADQLEYLSAETTRSASVGYVDDDYASDVVALDDYGDWEYSSSASTNVWVPRVSVGWTPYSFGTWYNTPVGLTWWSSDPWGWYPYHYGSWYFDIGFRNWCWVPAYTYSPAWVYWAYTPSHIGWCPVGYYSFYSPWFDSYYRRWGWNRFHRGGLAFAISGTFRKDQIDFGGWNFTAAGSFGSSFDRVSVVSGSRIAPTLNDRIAISGKPIVVSSRGDSLPRAIQTYIKQAPGRIERTSPDGSRLAPVLARQKTLPDSTLDALKDRAVVAGRGKLAGPGAEALASRGVVVDRGRSVKDALASAAFEKGRVDRGIRPSPGRKALPERAIGAETAREAPTVRGPETADVWRGRGREMEKVEKRTPENAPAPMTGDWRGRGPEKPQKSERVAPEAAPPAGDWRGRGSEKRQKAERPEAAPRERQIDRTAPAPAPGDDWRGRAPSTKRQAPPPAAAPRQKPGKQFAREDDWRGRQGSRSEVSSAPQPRAQDWRRDPPAKRVIEGAVPGRRWQSEAQAPPAKRAPSAERRQQAPKRAAPAPRSYGYERKEYRPAPAPERAAPAPRSYGYERKEYRSAPAPAAREYRPEYRPQPAPRAREYSAPPRAREYSAPPPSQRNSARPAPAPAPNVNSKGHGKGRKG
jgi:hypothetical protein